MNDTPEHADRLTRWLDGVPAHVNLIRPQHDHEVRRTLQSEEAADRFRARCARRTRSVHDPSAPRYRRRCRLRASWPPIGCRVRGRQPPRVALISGHHSPAQRLQVHRVERIRHDESGIAGAFGLGGFESRAGADRGSRKGSANGSRPIVPSPMCACRSTRLPSGFFESFAWMTASRSNPQACSNAANVAS